MIEFSPNILIGDVQDRITHQDLIQATHALYDRVIAAVRDLPDAYMTFEPEDPVADDPYAATEPEKTMPWTLAHVIVHITASCEEAAARGTKLARGLPVTGRSRYEVPWQTVTTTQQVLHRLEESRRMQLGFLSAWPDEPHLDITYDRYEKVWGRINAVGMVLTGLQHAAEHLYQIEDIIGQARAALG